MPSPFPGMDPFLEGKHWVSFHIELSVEMRRQLSPQLRPNYHVLTMERFVTETPGAVGISRRDVYPDTAVIHETTPIWTTPTPPKPVQVATPMPQNIPHYVVEIRTADKRELVASIELLSPANKRGKGYSDYLDKRYAILQSRVHLIEIDWLRRGQRVPMSKELPSAPYYIFLSRAEKRPILDVWPIQLNSTLPTIPVPLLNDEEAMLDLQAAFNAVYDSVGYDELIDYIQPPDVPLEGKTAVTAQVILQKAGFIKFE
ncbi:MAG: DUF4058 family protein [Chloroflexi bacterium]|nr:MAG: DUF4058 family protein [Chloroflexota bacterium]